MRSGDEPGSIEYSAVTQPLPLPRIHRGTSSSIIAVHSTAGPSEGHQHRPLGEVGEVTLEGDRSEFVGGPTVCSHDWDATRRLGHNGPTGRLSRPPDRGAIAHLPMNDPVTEPALPHPSSDTRDGSRRDRRLRRVRRRRWTGGIALVVVVAALAALVVWKGPSILDEPATATVAASTPAPSVPSGLVAVDDTASSGPAKTIDNRVFVIGDSVMQGASFVLADKMPDWSLLMDTKVGRFTREGVKVARGWKERGDIGQIAVVGLGNNFTPGEDIRSEIDDMMGVLSDTEHVIWFTAAEYRPAQAEVNAALRAAAQRYPKLVLVDWDSWYEAHRGFTGRDHLHLTPEGAEAYSSLIAASVAKVTQAANEQPAPGASRPQMYTKGVIPGSGPGSATSGSSTTKTTTRSRGDDSPPDGHDGPAPEQRDDGATDHGTACHDRTAGHDADGDDAAVDALTVQDAAACGSTPSPSAKRSYSSEVSVQSSNWMMPSSVNFVRSHAVAGVEEAELLAVRHDLREQHVLELGLLRRRVVEDGPQHGPVVDAHPVPHLEHEEAVAQPLRRLEGELLAVADLGGGQLGVVVLQREHAEGDVAGLVAHDVAQQLLEQRLGGDHVDGTEGRERQALDHDLHAEVGHVPAPASRIVSSMSEPRFGFIG